MKLAVTSVTNTCSRRLRAGRQSVSVSESAVLLPRLGRLLAAGYRGTPCSDSLLLVSSESPVLSSFRLRFALLPFPRLAPPPGVTSFPLMCSPTTMFVPDRCPQDEGRPSLTPLFTMIPLLLELDLDTAAPPVLLPWKTAPHVGRLTLCRFRARRLNAWLARSLGEEICGICLCCPDPVWALTPSCLRWFDWERWEIAALSKVPCRLPDPDVPLPCLSGDVLKPSLLLLDFSSDVMCLLWAEGVALWEEPGEGEDRERLVQAQLSAPGFGDTDWMKALLEAELASFLDVLPRPV